MVVSAPAQLSQVQQVDWLLEQAQTLEAASALELVWQAHALAQFMGYTAGVAHSLQRVAQYELRLRQLEQAQGHLRVAFELSQQIRNRKVFEACLETAQQLFDQLSPSPANPLPSAA